MFTYKIATVTGKPSVRLAGPRVGKQFPTKLATVKAAAVAIWREPKATKVARMAKRWRNPNRRRTIHTPRGTVSLQLITVGK